MYLSEDDMYIILLALLENSNQLAINGETQKSIELLELYCKLRELMEVEIC